MDDIKNITVIKPNRVIKDYSVGIYARVSTNSKEQMDSLAAQVSGLTRIAAAHRTWFVADIFIDVASAKKDSHRKEFDRMLKACEDGSVDIVLTKSISRFGRDSVETLEAIRRIKASGKRGIFERDRIDTETVDGELLISVIEACEQSENEWRSENIRWGLKNRAEAGTSGLYNRACYGYRKDKNGMLEIDEERASVVRNVFDWYLEGESVVGIIKRLENKRIKSPKGNDKWSKRTIETMLVNRKYTGDVAIANSGVEGGQFLKTENHAGIITQAKFDAVQLEMASRSNVDQTDEGRKRKKTKYSSKRRK